MLTLGAGPAGASGRVSSVWAPLLLWACAALAAAILCATSAGLEEAEAEAEVEAEAEAPPPDRKPGPGLEPTLDVGTAAGADISLGGTAPCPFTSPVTSPLLRAFATASSSYFSVGASNLAGSLQPLVKISNVGNTSALAALRIPCRATTSASAHMTPGSCVSRMNAGASLRQARQVFP